MGWRSKRHRHAPTTLLFMYAYWPNQKLDFLARGNSLACMIHKLSLGHVQWLGRWIDDEKVSDDFGKNIAE